MGSAKCTVIDDHIDGSVSQEDSMVTTVTHTDYKVLISGIFNQDIALSQYNQDVRSRLYFSTGVGPND